MQRALVSPIVKSLVGDLLQRGLPNALTSVSTSGNLLGGVTLNFTTPASGNLATSVKIYRTPTGVSLDRITHLVETLAVSMATAYSRNQGDVTRTNIFTNADFAAGSTGYTLQAGWSVGSGVATRTNTGSPSAIFQLPTLAIQNYRTAFQVTAYTSGGVAMRLASVTGTYRTAIGTYYQTLNPNASGAQLAAAFGNGAFAGSVDNLVVYPETVDCLARGTYDIYAEPTNASGSPGPLSGPHTVTIV